MTTPPKELVWKFSPFGPFPNQMRHSKSKRLVFLSPPPSKRCVCPLSSPIEGARLLLPQCESPDQTERIWTSSVRVRVDVNPTRSSYIFRIFALFCTSQPHHVFECVHTVHTVHHCAASKRKEKTTVRVWAPSPVRPLWHFSKFYRHGQLPNVCLT